MTITVRMENPALTVECEDVTQVVALISALRGPQPEWCPRVPFSKPQPEEAAPCAVAAPLPPAQAVAREAAPPSTPTATTVEAAPVAAELTAAAAAVASATTEPSPTEEELPPVTYSGTKMIGAGNAVLTAFSRDQNYPLTKLAKHIYGTSEPEAMRQLSYLLNSLVHSQKLKKLGRTTYKALQAP